MSGNGKPPKGGKKDRGHSDGGKTWKKPGPKPVVFKPIDQLEKRFFELQHLQDYALVRQLMQDGFHGNDIEDVLNYHGVAITQIYWGNAVATVNLGDQVGEVNMGFVCMSPLASQYPTVEEMYTIADLTTWEEDYAAIVLIFHQRVQDKHLGEVPFLVEKKNTPIPKVQNKVRHYVGKE